jgi:hypothetical protein
MRERAAKTAKHDAAQIEEEREAFEVWFPYDRYLLTRSMQSPAEFSGNGRDRVTDGSCKRRLIA